MSAGDSMSALAPVPAHVPAECVIDFDVYAVTADGRGFFETWAALQRPDLPEMLWTGHNGGHWIATRGADIHRLIGDAARLSNAPLTVPTEIGKIANLIPLQADPPDHAGYRGPVQKAFGSKHTLDLEPTIRELARTLIAEARGKGSCEFVTEFAENLPIYVFLMLVGLPVEDRVMLRQFGEQFTRPDGSVTPGQLIGQVTEYLRPHVEARLARPGTDLLSRILAMPVNGRPWTNDEAMRMCRNLLLGGLDTVAALFGFVLQFLAENPEAQAALRARPELITKGAADEFIRRFGSVMVVRRANADFEVGGISVRAGDVLLLPTMLNNLDDRSFENAGTVDFNRGLAPHSTMGNGPHRCVGADLARIELVTFLEEWLAQIPTFGLDPDRPVRRRGGTVGALMALPLRWNAG